MGIIYKITCVPTNLSYIGKTIQKLNVRLRQHQDKRSYCRLLTEEIKKHGWDNFKYDILWEGENEKLGEMERNFIIEHNTIEPNGLNLREGGGKSERVSETSRKLMIDKQREISKNKTGNLGKIIENKHSYSFKFTVNYVYHSINFKTLEEAQKAQEDFTNNPDTFPLPEPKRVGNGKGSIYLKGSKWYVILPGNVYLGIYETKEEAKKVIEEYRKDPENFTREPEVKSKPKFYVYEMKRTRCKQNYILYIVKTYEKIDKKVKDLAYFRDKKAAEYYCETLQYNDRYDIV